MTKQEAIQALKEGRKVRHKWFSNDEPSTWRTVNYTMKCVLAYRLTSSLNFGAARTGKMNG